MPNIRKPVVVILTYDHLRTFEFGCAFEVFGLPRPEMGPDWYRCLTAAGEPGRLRGAGGLYLEPAGDLHLLAEADTVIIPGWRGPQDVAPAPMLQALRQAHARGTRIVAICGGAFVLAQAGLLSGRRVTTHWLHIAALAAQAPDARIEPDMLYIDEGDILTSAGSAAGLDLCIHLVRKDFGAKAANSVARRLVVAAHRDGGQAQFIERPLPPPAGQRLSVLLDTIQARIGENWTVERMAAAAHISTRSLHRHIVGATGLAPGAWLLQQRIAYARTLLEETSLPVEDVANRSGLGSATNFRQHFRTVTGLTPTTYRHRFASWQ
ncbi:transcriptional regulator FtrA [Aestuariispira ectoiniformans]|uniref:transcriptional regulator FtrA n=1 Tax=Aestuariispira ectoiniformans TaxID=2775080 RepID=UPI00223C530D|nr:transcriptional regulator FtrA [Aestuariispira ectoiniformans]